MSKFFRKHRHRILVTGIILSFILLSVGSAMRESLTYDEIMDMEEGWRNLVEQKITEPYNLPFIRELQVLPLVIGQTKPLLLQAGALPARLVTVGLGVLLLIAVYRVASHLFGASSGILSLFFLAFEPNTLAHSHYITFDAGTSLFFFLAYSAYVGRSSLFGLSLGLALASRIFVVPCFVVSVGMAVLLKVMKPPHMRFMLASLIVALGIVWATYFFRWEVVIAKGGYSGRLSERIKNIAIAQKFEVVAAALSFFENRPLPLGNYFATIKNAVIRSARNAEHPSWYEMPVNVFLKTPIPLLLLAAIALVRVKRVKKGKRGSQQALLFLIPIVGIVVVAALTGMESRVRYVLPIYPFIAMVAAVGIGKIREIKGIWGNMIPPVLLLWYVVGSLLQFPHFISYTNEFVPRQARYRYFTDSNIDWGQSLPDLKMFVEQEKPSHLSFSYFGRDNGNDYGLISNRQWGSYKFEDICALHEIALPYEGERLVAISVSNWYGCGYSKQREFAKENIQTVVGDSILIFK